MKWTSTVFSSLQTGAYNLVILKGLNRYETYCATVKVWATFTWVSGQTLKQAWPEHTIAEEYG